MLNYGYDVLAGRVELAIRCGGLDPAVGLCTRRIGEDNSPLAAGIRFNGTDAAHDGCGILEFATREPLDPEAFSLARKSPKIPSGAVRLKDDSVRTIAVISDNAIHYSPIKLLPKPLNLLPRN